MNSGGAASLREARERSEFFLLCASGHLWRVLKQENDRIRLMSF